MTYRVRKLAAGSYDLILNGVIVAGLVRNNLDQPATWTVELLMDLPAHLMPPPFTASEHHFASLEEACKWLGLSVDEVMYVTGSKQARERF